ncbi:N-acetylmuramoyl-L-alanine amidase [Catenulispora pinisilvae]|uniref:N-acetylmuramoyl-L-alanine amidase n=1 Tax=Catenulispora pinisilvae TaxID=2705253 RepID=UPI001891C3EC|nr:N-acetylmuramoyl-L-alanine amidase [Catenulispora pinisilvae]
MRRPPRRRALIPVVATALVAAAAAVVPAAHSAAAAGSPMAGPKAGPSSPADPAGRQAAFAAAAAEFGVPLPVLLSVSYNESLWEAHGGKPSFSAGYGPMNLTNLTQAELNSAGFTSTFRSPDLLTAPSLHTAAKAAALAGVDLATAETNDVQNIRAGAALLASYEKQYNHSVLPPALDLSGWTVGVARYAEASETKVAQVFTDDVFTTIRTGQSATTQDGQTLSLPAQPWAFDDPNGAKRLGLVSVVPPADPVHDPSQISAPECPADLDCSYSPSGFYQLSATDKSDYGDHDPANRPVTTDIRYITLHDNEETNDGTLWLFHDPSYFASANYEVRSEDGHVTQLLPTEDIAWDSGNESFYQHSVGIEQEGYAIDGATWYSEAMYHSTAALVRYLAAKYDIPLDRQHILGHDNIPGSSDGSIASQHWDPGPYWNWSHFMDLVGAPIHADAPPSSNVVAVNPVFQLNQQVVSGCQNIQDLTPFPGPYHGAEWPNLNGPCPASYYKDMPKQPTSFVFLRTAPSDSAPLLSDPYLHTDGSAGTIQADDWGDKASAGQEFVVADRAPGGWIAIWYAGQKAWFHNDLGPVSAAPVKALTVTPKPGKATVPVYVESFPEASAYPAAFTSWYGGVPRSQRIASKYVLAAGQAYVTDGKPLQSDWFNAYNIDGSAFMDQTDFKGATQYYLITYNHRMAFVNAADVNVVASTS